MNAQVVTLAAASVLLAGTAAAARSQEGPKVAAQGKQAEPGRVVLAGVPRVGFFNGGPRPPEDDPFPACLRAYLEYVGDDLGFGKLTGKADPWHDVHTHLMGVSGSAFRILWDTRAWSHHITAIDAQAPDALRPFRQAFDAAGYDCEILLQKEFASSHGVRQDAASTEADFRARIVESIRDKKRPVIAIGVVGPAECCLITGYDEGGDVLIGWSFFQDDPDPKVKVDGKEPSGYFRKRDWFKDTPGLILIGEKKPRPSNLDVIRQALRFGLELMRTPDVRGTKCGQAAFTAWSAALLNDASFSIERMEELKSRNQIHHDNAGSLAECRAWGSWWLSNVAEMLPEVREEALAASQCFNGEHDLVWAMWEFTSGMNTTDEGARKLADHGTRGRIVPLIRLARDLDRQAAQHLEKALRILDERATKEAQEAQKRNPNALVKREGNRVWIQGIPPLRWATGRDCTFIGALEAATSVTGHPASYAEMMGNTGLAFRLRWSNPETKSGWCTSSACGEFLEEFVDVSVATGWRLDACFDAPKGDPQKDPVLKRIRETIDAGYPFIGQLGGPDVSVIYGYADGGKKLLAQTYHKPTTQVYPLKSFGDWYIYLGHNVGAAEPKDALLRGLRAGARNWHRGKSSAGPYGGMGKEWHYGEQAFAKWADDLAKTDVAKLSDEQRRRFFEANGFCFLSLIDARRAAVKYLRAKAPLLDAEPAKALLRAASIYETEADALEAAYKRGDASGYPADGALARWTTEMRQCEAQQLREAAKQEAGAAAEIEKALAAYEAAHPTVRDPAYDRLVLQGVPQVGFGVRFNPFNGSLESALKYVGDPTDYDYLMGASGACFRRFFEKDDGGNIDLMYLTPEPWKRAARAIGYDMHAVSGDKETLKQAIKQSLANGRPVIAFGIIGPPEAGLITGYDRDGEVVHGWSYFAEGSQVYYQKQDWFEGMARGGHNPPPALLVLGDKDRWGAPSKRDTLLSSLRWAIDLARTPERACAPGHKSGLAAYDAWADAVLVDADYPKDKPDVLATRIMVHGDQTLMLEERRSAAKYLRMMADAAPEAKTEMLAAADLYDKAAGARVWPWGDDMGPATQQALADGRARREIAAQIRAAREAEAAAVAHLEKAVALMEAKDRG